MPRFASPERMVRALWRRTAMRRRLTILIMRVAIGFSALNQGSRLTKVCKPAYSNGLRCQVTTSTVRKGGHFRFGYASRYKNNGLICRFQKPASSPAVGINGGDGCQL